MEEQFETADSVRRWIGKCRKSSLTPWLLLCCDGGNVFPSSLLLNIRQEPCWLAGPWRDRKERGRREAHSKIKALRKSKMSKKGRGGTGYFRLLLLLLQQELGTGPPTVLESSSFLKCMVAWISHLAVPPQVAIQNSYKIWSHSCGGGAYCLFH